MVDKVAFELVSPERLLVAKDVDMVVIPGAEGDFGVLPGHAPFMSGLRPGLIEIYEQNRVVERLFVAGGFAEVTPERCTVLAKEAAPLAELSREQAEARLKRAERDLAEATDAKQRAAAEIALAIAQAMVGAAEMDR
jgi:F-type H+-transporting ATPase subunit epsilon